MKGSQLRIEIENLGFHIIPDRTHGDEIVFVCPEPGCGDVSGNRSANLKNGKTSCWKCGKGGDFVRWARRLGYKIEEDGTVSAEMSESEELLRSVEPEKTFVPVTSDAKLPRGFIRCADRMESVYTRMIGEMAVRKNLSLDDMVEAGVGFTKTDPVWEPYAIFPVSEWGQLVYYQGRTYVDEPGESTKRFPDRNSVKLGSKYWVYNVDEARESRAKVIIVVESILNVLSLRKKIRQLGVEGVTPVAIFKHAISSPQQHKMLSCKHASEICLMFDPDALREAWKTAQYSLPGRRDVTVAEMPVGIDANDDVDAAWKRFESRKESKTASSTLRSLTLNLRA